MGTWGKNILQDDSALDAYGRFIEQYNLGLSPADIRKQLDKQRLFQKRCIEDNTPYWLGIAQAQWECGALDSDVREVVQQIIDEDLEKEVWEDAYPARKRALARFLSRISRRNESPLKRVKPRAYSIPFEVGDCLAFHYPDGKYGAAFCLKAMRESAILAITRIHQPKPPTLKQVAASHVLVKEWFESGITEPAIGVQVIHDQKSALDARSLEVIGRLQVTRSYGEALYGSSFAWNLDFYGSLQFAWEKKHGKNSRRKKYLPVQEFIVKREDDWEKVG
jgi:hypothetical protein